MSQNTTYRFGAKEQKIFAALTVVMIGCYASALATVSYGYWPGAAGAFVALLGSMYLLSQVMRDSK